MRDLKLPINLNDSATGGERVAGAKVVEHNVGPRGGGERGDEEERTRDTRETHGDAHETFPIEQGKLVAAAGDVPADVRPIESTCLQTFYGLISDCHAGLSN